jgi:outer membrane protein assembly factor BamB
LVASLFALVLTGCVWSQPGFGPDRQAFQPFEHSINAGNVGSLQVAWNATLDGIVADPISVSGAVYANTPTSVYEFRLGDGSPVWATKLTDPTLPFQTLSRVSATHGMIVAPRLDFHGSSLQRLNAATGAIEAPLPGLGGVDAAITRGDTLVAPTLQWGTNFCLYGIVAIDVTGPTRLWQTPFPDTSCSVTNYRPTSAALSSTTVYVGRGPAIVAYPLSEPNPCPTPPGYCAPAWSTDVGGTATTPVLSSDGVTVFAGTAAGDLVALDASSGAINWRAKIGAAITAPPALHDQLYVGATDGTLTAFNPAGCGAGTCNPRWHASTGSAITVQPAVANGVVYTGSSDGGVHAFAAGCRSATQFALWSANAGSAITGAPAVALGHLLVGTHDGHLVAYSL